MPDEAEASAGVAPKALCEAAGEDDEDALDRILGQYAATLRQTDEATWQAGLDQALWEACWEGLPGNVRLLLRHGAKITDSVVRIAGKSGNPAEIWETFIAHGFDVNKKLFDQHRKEETTPLVLAAYNVDCLRILLDHGADINGTYDDPMYRPRKEGRSLPFPRSTALDHAAKGSKLEPVQFLLDRGAVVNPGILFSPLTKGCHGGLPMLELLIKAGADVNAAWPCSYGSVLHCAIIRGRPKELVKEMVSMLMEAGADPTVRFKDGKEPNSALGLAKEMEEFHPGLYELMVKKWDELKAQGRGEDVDPES